MQLELSRCTLRPWRVGDEASLVRYADNRNVSRNMRDRFPYPYTAADADGWIKKAGAEKPATSFAIVVDGAAVGGVGIELGTDVFRRSAEIGYWLGEPFWGRGIATEALRAMTTRLPSRCSPVTVLPVTALTGGSTERSRKGVSNRTRSSRAPRMRGASASR